MQAPVQKVRGWARDSAFLTGSPVRLPLPDHQPRAALKGSEHCNSQHSCSRFLENLDFR